MVDLDPVEQAHPVDPEVAPIVEVTRLELVVQEVVLEVLAVEVALVVYFDLEESELLAGKVQSSRTGTQFSVFMCKWHIVCQSGEKP